MQYGISLACHVELSLRHHFYQKKAFYTFILYQLMIKEIYLDTCQFKTTLHVPYVTNPRYQLQNVLFVGIYPFSSQFLW